MKLFEPIRSKEARDYSLTNYLQWLMESYTVGGNTYAAFNTTIPGQKIEPISDTFSDYTRRGLKSNSVVFGLERIRIAVFSQGRFQWQQMSKGRPTNLFGSPDLALLENPWMSGVTSDLLALMLLDADMAGNAYYTKRDEILRLRPDWIEVVLGDRPGGGPYKKLGYIYYEGGKGAGNDGQIFPVNEVAHFMPMPDPEYSYRGMSWITPIIRELMADTAATSHKLKFFENAGTPNLAVSLPKEISPAQFEEFVDAMDDSHKGWENAYKTLYTAGGADVTVIGANMQQLDFKVTQGAGETRIALAAGVHPTVAALSEGMQGSSLNAGNYGAARRSFSDITLAHLWGNVSASLQTIFPPPAGARLTIDKRDIPFLAEDQKDAAAIMTAQATAIRQLTDGGYEPDSVVTAVLAGDLSKLTHTGLLPVQLQPPGSGDMNNPGQDTPDLAPAPAPSSNGNALQPA